MTDPDKPRISAPFETQFDSARLQDWTIRNLIRQIHTATLVRVTGVFPGPGYAGFVDVQPMVQENTTRNIVIEQAPIFKLPYLRIQGGTSAIISDPVIGDIGLAVFAERDITTVVNTRDQAAAATDRVYSAGDGLYLGGFLNNEPTQFVEFLPEDAGINITTPGDLVIDVAGDFTATVGGAITVAATSTTWSGPVNFLDEVTIQGIPFGTHKHTAQGATAVTTGPQA